MRVLLISTYELGRQPFGLTSPAAWIGATGADVECLDLALQDLDERAVRRADAVGLYLPMHTATQIALAVLPRLREWNSAARPTACCGPKTAPQDWSTPSSRSTRARCSTQRSNSG